MADPEISDSTAAVPAGVAVDLKSLTVRIGERTLLDNASAHFAAGEVALIVGCSGVGKSVLLRILAGLIGRDHDVVRVTGEVKIGDRRAGHGAGVGVVFQNFALFDELSPAENVNIAASHRTRGAGPSPGRATALLTELQVPRRAPTAALSGGQRQRLAIARTLAQDANVILYDEPTSGLDAATATLVARLIRDTHAAHPKTSIIVTHDYESLSAIADRIFLFDWQSQSLKEIPAKQWPDLKEMLTPPTELESKPSRSAGALAAPTRMLGDFFASTSQTLESVLLFPVRLLPLWKSPLWGIRFLWHYLRLVAGPSAWLYIAIAGAIIGFVTTYFTFRFMPYRQHTEVLLLDDLLTAIGFALFRVLTPVLVTILIAARSGAAVASDIGAKSYGGQLDALKTLGVRPASYLATGVIYAFLVGAPLLMAIGYAAAAATSAAVFTATHANGPEYWRLYFHKGLPPSPTTTLYDGVWWLLAKVLFCAAGTALIAYGQGAAPKLSGSDISRSITRTILWATLWVLLVHFVFAFIEF